MTTEIEKLGQAATSNPLIIKLLTVPVYRITFLFTLPVASDREWYLPDETDHVALWLEITFDENPPHVSMIKQPRIWDTSGHYYYDELLGGVGVDSVPEGSYRERDTGIVGGPIASVDAYKQYWWKKQKASLHTYSFLVSEYEMHKIWERIFVLGEGTAHCADYVSQAVAGVGPFGSVKNRTFPKYFESDIRKIHAQSSRAVP